MRPQIFELKIWHRQQKLILSNLVEALLCLRKESLCKKEEAEITDELYWCIERCLKNNNLGKEFTVYPPDSPMPPKPKKNKKKTSEQKEGKKRPDLQIAWTNQQAVDLSHFRRIYVIECKRLGNALSGNVNKLYFNLGIKRFDCKIHRYADEVVSGAMVGYVQNMEFDVILNEINHAASSDDFAELVLSKDGWQIEGVSLLGQKLKRSQLNPKNFDLHHFWVDVREKNDA